MREDDVQQGLTPDDLTDPTTDPTQPTPRASSGPVTSQRATSPRYAYTYGGNGTWNATPGYTGDPYTGQFGGQDFNRYLHGGGASPDDWTRFAGDARQRNLPLPNFGSGDTGYDWLGFAQRTTGGQNVSRGGSQGGFITGGGAYRGKLQSLVDAYNKEFGTQAKVAGDDKIDFGDGRGPQDVITGGGDFWYGGAPGSMQQGPPAGGAGGGLGSGGSGSSPSPSAGAEDPAIHQAIMDLLARGSNPLSANDPALRAQFDPVSRQLQAGAKRTREAAAERLAASGNNSGGQGGALDAEVNGINESLGEQQGAAMGKFTTAELAARRQDVVNAISLAQGEQRIALQAQLQQIDAELRRQALSQQNSQFYDEFTYRMGRDNRNSDEDFLRRLLGE